MYPGVYKIIIRMNVAVIHIFIIMEIHHCKTECKKIKNKKITKTILAVLFRWSKHTGRLPTFFF